MLSKKCLFGGGLYLSNTIVTSLLSIAIAEEYSIVNKKNQIHWRFYSYDKINEATGEHKWLKGKKYYNSIVKVIGEAIGDCMALEGEFEHNFMGCVNREELGFKTIIFRNTNPLEYTRANWNAVILYNAVNYMINNPNSRVHVCNTDVSLIQNSYSILKTHYTDEDEFVNQETMKRELSSLKRRLEQTGMCIISQMLKNSSAKENAARLLESLRNFELKPGDEDVYDKLINNLHSVASECNKITAIDDKLAKLKTQIEQYKTAIKLSNQYDEMFQKLELAKKDMLQYASALNLCNILSEYRDILEEGSPAKVVPHEKLKVEGKKYRIFYYDKMLDYHAKHVMTFGHAYKNNDSAKSNIIYKTINFHYIPYFIEKEKKIYLIKMHDIEHIIGQKTMSHRNQSDITDIYNQEYNIVFNLLDGLVNLPDPWFNHAEFVEDSL